MKNKILICALLLAIAFPKERLNANENFNLYAGFLSDISNIDLSVEEIEVPIIAEEEPPECPYSYEDLELLARVIYAEAGSIKNDETLHYVGSVVVNRMANEELYPNTIFDVVYDKRFGIQYACAYNGAINKTPDDRCMEIATEVLDKYYEEGETYLPSNVLGQAGFKTLHGVYVIQDGIYFSYY